MASCVTNLTCVHCGTTYHGANVATAQSIWMTCPHCGSSDGILDIGDGQVIAAKFFGRCQDVELF